MIERFDRQDVPWCSRSKIELRWVRQPRKGEIVGLKKMLRNPEIVAIAGVVILSGMGALAVLLLV